MKKKFLKNRKKILLAAISGILILTYMLAGQLRFFINNYVPLTFFVKDYLVILQNDTELRPAGGFLTSFGRIKFVFGIPIIKDFQNSYEIEPSNYTFPPYPHKELLGSTSYQGYSFRDANWEANFPDNTTQLLDFYYQENPKPKIDGIFVINYNLIEEFLKNLGEIKLGDRIVSNNNLFELLEFNVNNIDKHNIDALSGRKNIINDIAKKIIIKSILNPIKAKNTIIAGLENKDFYMWFQSERLQKNITNKNWGNTLNYQTGSDFLSINLANLGSKKSDRYTYIEADHFINLSNPEPEINLTVKIVNPISKNSYNDTYKGYLRIYIPASSYEINSNVDTNTEMHGKLKAIGTIINIEPQDSKEYKISYKLPASIFKNNTYQTIFSKQSGSKTYYSSHVESKIGSTINSSEYSTTENFALSKFELKKDKTVKIEIQKDQLPPVVDHQIFEDTNTLKIIWNEPLDDTDITNTNNYTITDKNSKNSVNDDIIIERIEFLKPNSIKLYTSGISNQPNEAYEVLLNNVKDQSGNLMSPKPYKITVIQRLNSINL